MTKRETAEKLGAEHDPATLATALTLALIRVGTPTTIRLAQHVELVVDVLVNEVDVTRHEN